MESLRHAFLHKDLHYVFNLQYFKKNIVDISSNTISSHTLFMNQFEYLSSNFCLDQSICNNYYHWEYIDQRQLEEQANGTMNLADLEKVMKRFYPAWNYRTTCILLKRFYELPKSDKEYYLWRDIASLFEKHMRTADLLMFDIYVEEFLAK
eukprot:UN31947